MALSPQDLETEALKLDIDARAKLAEKLIRSLDSPSDEEAERLWTAEAERRLAELRQGTVAGRPAQEVLDRALSDLRGH